MFGYRLHIQIDGHKCAVDSLDSIEGVRQALLESLGPLGLKALMPPYVYEYAGLHTVDRGVSGFVLLQEGGHVSIHTFPEKEFVSIDVFSNHVLDAEVAIGCFQESFGFERYTHRELIRGMEFPKGAGCAADVVRNQRGASN